MSPRLTTILLVALLSLASGAGVYWFAGRGAGPARTPDPLAWIRSEFQPTDAQLDTIRRMHEAHGIVCEVHCANIAKARAEVDELERASAPENTLAEARARLAAADLECRTSIEGHVRRIADVLGDDKGKRYLGHVLPRLAHFDHTGAPDPGLDHPHAPRSP